MSGEQKLLWLFVVLLGLGLIAEVFIWVKKIFFIIKQSGALNEREDI